MNLTRQTAIALVLPLSMLAAGCGSDSGGAENDASATPSAEAKPDFQAAHDDWHALLDLEREVNTAQQAVNRATKAFLDADPKGDLSDPRITDPIADLEGQIQNRDEAIAQLNDSAAADDPALKEPWGAFSVKHQAFNAYADSFFLDIPTLQQGLRGCAALFGTMADIKGPSQMSEVDAYNKKRLRVYRTGQKFCFAPMERLSTSDNPAMKRYASGWSRIHQKREALLTKAAAGKLNIDQIRVQYKALGAEESELKFDPQGDLNRLFPKAEKDAFDQAIHAAPGVEETKQDS